MKVFKKILFVFLGLIAFAAISLYVFLKVREYRSERGLVHSESSLVIKISIDRILEDIVLNALINPSYYFSKDTSATSTDRNKIRSDIGIGIPANLYLFSLADNPNTLYTTLIVQDDVKLHQFLERNLGNDTIKVKRKGHVWSFESNDHRISFIGDKEFAILSISLDKTSNAQQLDQLWTARTKMKPVADLKEFLFDNKDADIQWKSRRGNLNGELSMLNGRIISTFTLPNDVLKLPVNASARKLSVGNVVSFYCEGDLRPLFEKYREVLNQYNIPVDSLKQYYGGYFDFQWSDTDVIQQDSVIAYDYDENFNMIEKREIREESVPNISFNIKASPHLATFLPHKLFYKFYQHINDDKISLSTAPTSQDGSSIIESEGTPLGLTYNYSDAVIRHFGWLPKVERISEVKIEGRGGDVGNTFRMDLIVVDKHIHALYQLLK